MRLFSPTKPTRVRALITLRYANSKSKSAAAALALAAPAVLHLAASGSNCVATKKQLQQWGFNDADATALCDAAWPQFAVTP